ncbi:MAG: sigma-54-dependent Fis family transcriptional regulator [Candidatus Aureabacteria bacterium]|nr:sigma-54-dependent Fis family transcriptional regulator [Candidatus Auribacterota bacterium]
MTDISLLIVEDDNALATLLKEKFEKSGCSVQIVNDAKSAISVMQKDSFEVSLIDLRLPDMDGIDLLKEFKKIRPFHQSIILTGVTKVDKAVAAIKAGAYDYVTKPCDLDKLQFIVGKSYENNLYLRRKTAFESTKIPESFIAVSDSMKSILSIVDMSAKTSGTVLITGESGTGKELVAREIHKRGERCREPFVVINCSAIPESIFESELFGHEKGSFTNAVSQKIGLFEVANKGSVFLDEISEMPLSMQVKLLRVLQFKEFRRVGSNCTMHTNIKIIAASNKDLAELVKEGAFREDLYYRINVLDINIPPLRERKEALPHLIDYFLKIFAGDKKYKFTAKAKKMINDYNWPGNVRELKNVIERAVILAKDNIITDIDLRIFQKSKNSDKESDFNDLDKTLEEVEKAYVKKVLESQNGNKTKSAKKLGISIQTLYNKLKD